MAFYNCPYILRTGEVYNWECYRAEGCKVHCNSKQIPCKECSKLINSTYKFCDIWYAKKHRAKEHYHQKKLAKMASTQVMVGNLEVNKNNTTCH